MQKASRRILRILQRLQLNTWHILNQVHLEFILDPPLTNPTIILFRIISDVLIVDLTDAAVGLRSELVKAIAAILKLSQCLCTMRVPEKAGLGTGVGDRGGKGRCDQLGHIQFWK